MTRWQVRRLTERRRHRRRRSPPVGADEHIVRTLVVVAEAVYPSTVEEVESFVRDVSTEYWAISDDEDRVAAAYDLHVATERLDDDGGIDADEWDDAAPDTPHPSERDDEETT